MAKIWWRTLDIYRAGWQSANAKARNDGRVFVVHPGEKMLCALPYSAESLRTNCGPQPITRVILHDTLSRGLVGSPFVSGHLAYQTRPTDCRPI